MDDPRDPPETRDARPEPEGPRLAAIASRARAREPDRDPPAKGISGILVPVLPVEPEPLVLFTRRSEQLSAHPGEISYPGGRMETVDESPRETALRETEEETGIQASAIDVLGHFTDFHTFHDILICGYVGLVDPHAELLEPTTPDEVAERLLVPLRALVEGSGELPAGIDEEIHLGTRGLGRVYPVRSYEARKLPPDERGGGLLHYWHLTDDTTIWGITGELTARLFRGALDWEPPEPPREIEGREDVYP